MKSKPVLLILLLIFSRLTAQTVSNLDLINGLIDKSVLKIESKLGAGKSVCLNVTIPSSLEVLKSRIYSSFGNRGISIKSSPEEASSQVNYTLISAKIDYLNSYSDGFLGGTLIEREAVVSGSYLITGKDKTVLPFEFNETARDTLKLDNFKGIEQQSLPFTQSKLPSLPLLSGLWEPIIAVSTLIVSVILLFTVRSK